jgi:hypothetical protein
VGASFCNSLELRGERAPQLSEIKEWVLTSEMEGAGSGNQGKIGKWALASRFW